MSHSGAGSDIEYDYGMEGASGSSGPRIPPALMGNCILVFTLMTPRHLAESQLVKCHLANTQL